MRLPEALAGLLLATLALTGCAQDSGSAAAPPVAPGSAAGQDAATPVEDVTADAVVEEDVQQYMDEMMPLGSTEAEIISRYDAVTGTNYQDDETTYEALVEIVPDYTNYVTALEEVRPTTAEVRALHELYLEAANLQQAGMARFLTALETADASLVADANIELAEARRLLREWEAGLEALGVERQAD